jgi:hypothetical protein
VWNRACRRGCFREAELATRRSCQPLQDECGIDFCSIVDASD